MAVQSGYSNRLSLEQLRVPLTRKRTGRAGYHLPRATPDACQLPADLATCLALREDLEQLADLPLLDEGMPQGKLSLDLVAVPPALSLAQHVALFDELGQDPVGGALGDAYRSGNVAQADARVMSHTYKDVGVVCQKVPAAG